MEPRTAAAGGGRNVLRVHDAGGGPDAADRSHRPRARLARHCRPPGRDYAVHRDRPAADADRRGGHGSRARPETARAKRAIVPRLVVAVDADPPGADDHRAPAGVCVGTTLRIFPAVPSVRTYSAPSGPCVTPRIRAFNSRSRRSSFTTRP